MEIEKVRTIFGRTAPEEGYLVGYGAIIKNYNLKTPVPNKLALIIKRPGRSENGEWMLFGPSYKPKNQLYNQLVFALKYEGINLHLFKVLFQWIDKKELETMLQKEPTSQYSRRIWFLYEWLMEHKLNVPDLAVRDYFDLVDPKLQYSVTPINSKRHGIKNNLPGTKYFCPLISRTKKLETLIMQNLSKKVKDSIGPVQRDILLRASAFLLLEDSKASFAIEGERPPQNRARRWGAAIGQAGRIPLSKEELIRLQQIVIEKPQFKMGYRDQEGFIGTHDRKTLDPIPSHISARHKDLDILMKGLIDTHDKLITSDFDPILAATIVAFGFVFIHPFVDGNGRIHRYLIHHMLAAKGFSEKGLVFPVSAVILEIINEYREVLESFSSPGLDLIDWIPAPDHNVKIKNETIDLYRFFDATKHAEFLYDCVLQTIDKNLPEEIAYLQKYDEMKNFIDNTFDMPGKTVSLLITFLHQGKGKLSKRALSKELANLTSKEVEMIQETYETIFNTRKRII